MATFLSWLCLFYSALSAEGMFAPEDMSKGSGPVSDIGITSNLQPHPSSRPAQATPKKLYFDWTVPINKIFNEEEDDTSFLEGNKKAGSQSPIPNVFYTTDSLVRDLADLSPVTDLLDKNVAKEAPLYLSFRYMDGNNISEDRMGDVFYPFDISIPEDKLQSLKKHVSGIILDFRSNNSWCHHERYWRDEKFQDEKFKWYQEKILKYIGKEDPKWKIPFPKYAKKIAQKLLGDEDSSLKVGIIYNKYQMHCSSLLNQQKHADFLVINVDYRESWYPLTYWQFKQYLLEIQKSQISELSSNDMHEPTIMFRVNYHSRYYSPKNLTESDWPWGIWEDTQHARNILLKQFALTWTQEGMSELILSHEGNSSKSEGEAEVESRIDGKRFLVPVLNTQEVDVTPCQLRSMMGKVGTEYTSLVVNEYTWTAFARYENEMTEANCPNGVGLPPNQPETYLLFSSSVGETWNETEAFFGELLQKHQTISGWHLSTLVFPSKDVNRTILEGEGDSDTTIPTDIGIPKFARDLQEKYKIGCSVEITNGSRWGGYWHIYDEKMYLQNVTLERCKSLWDLSSVIVWHFNSSLDAHYFDTFLFKLILMRREAFMTEYPEKEVIIQIDVSAATEKILKKKGDYSHFPCSPAVSEVRDFYQTVQTWAGIHGVKIIGSPAYNMEEPTGGLWMPPKEDGKPSGFNLDECHREY